MPNSLLECDSDTIGDIFPPYWSLQAWSHVCPRGLSQYWRMSPMSLLMVPMQLVTSASVSQVES